MLGHVNSQFFSAVGNVLVPYNALTSVITAICCGTTVLIAQSYGAENKYDSKIYAENSFVGNALFSIFAFVLFFFAAKPIFRLMGVDSPVLEYSVSYMKILSFTLLIFGISSTAISILQSFGLTKIIMTSGIISNLINILLDYLLIFGKTGFSEMGIDGAAYASVISNYISLPILLIYVFRSRNMPIKLSISNIFNCKWKIYKKVLKIGIPSGMEYALWNVGNLIVVSFLNHLDMMAAGIYTLILSIETLPLLLYMGIANAGLTLVGQKTGANDHKQAVQIGFRCLEFSIIICAIIAVLFWIFPDKILSIFTDDSILVKQSVSYLVFIAFVLFPKAVNNVIGLGIRGLSDTKWMLYGQIFGTILVVVLSYILIFSANLGLMGVFITLFIDETLRGILNILRFWKGREFFCILKK